MNESQKAYFLMGEAFNRSIRLKILVIRWQPSLSPLAEVLKPPKNEEDLEECAWSAYCN